ncbi:MAG: hypothetical protein KAX77_04890 [Xanthomonadales bacterium]|nr:hypothetical protein [Xanthomonadales bacterium]
MSAPKVAAPTFAEQLEQFRGEDNEDSELLRQYADRLAVGVGDDFDYCDGGRQ